MRFVSVRDLRGKSGKVWGELAAEGELVLTSNGQPIAILAAVGPNELEARWREIRRARALRALTRLQLESADAGRDRMSKAAIAREIQAARRAR